MTADSAQAWYVYSLLPEAAAAPQGDGVLPDVPVHAIGCNGFTALASLVPRSLFDSACTGNRTREPDWLADRLAAHHWVNAAASSCGPCLPLAFGTLFSRLDLLDGWLAPRASVVRDALADVAGHSEWAVAVHEDVDAHAAWLDRHDPTLSRIADSIAAAGQGTAFLLSRQLHKARITARARGIHALGKTIEPRLAAAGTRMLPETSRNGLPAWTVLARSARAPDTAAPDDRQTDDIRTVVRGLDAELGTCGLFLRLSGPWPAYAFARTVLTKEAACV